MQKIPQVQLVNEYIPSVETILKSRSDSPELPLTTMPALNKILWGLKRGRVSVLASRPSHGKSAFALQIARDIASQYHPVMFLSLEMTIDEIIERLFCQHCRVSNQELLRGNFDNYKEDWAEFQMFVQDLPLVITDCIGKTWGQIDYLLTNMSTKPAVVIIDYIQNIAGGGRNSKEEIDEYIRHFEELTIRHRFAGILCSQINRASQDSEDKEPRLHHLKGTGKLEETPSVIALLHYPYKYSQTEENFNKYTVFLEKNRNGITGVVNMRFIPEFYLFEDMDAIKEKQVVSVLENFEGKVVNV